MALTGLLPLCDSTTFLRQPAHPTCPIVYRGDKSKCPTVILREQTDGDSSLVESPSSQVILGSVKVTKTNKYN